MTLSVLGCRQTKFVPQGKYLLKKNEVKVSGAKISKSELSSIIRQQPNFKSFGVKWKLMAYNSVDSAKVAEKRGRLNQELRVINKERKEREDRINAKRIAKAQAKNTEYYTHKTVRQKDTINPKMFFREWYKYKVGKHPVVFDSIPFEKTIKQFDAFLRTKGYYYGSVAGFVDYRENRKCVATYVLETGPRYMVEGVNFQHTDTEIEQHFLTFISRSNDHPLIGKPFDSDLLDDFRTDFSHFMRDSSYYGLSASNISFLADTNRQSMKVNLTVRLSDRAFIHPEIRDSVTTVIHKKRTIDEIIYHLPDTIFMSGFFSDSLVKRGISQGKSAFSPTLDTAYYKEGSTFVSSKEAYDAIFLYNSRLFIKPKVLEMFNRMERNQAFRERDVESTYNGFLRLGLFSSIKVELQESQDRDSLIAHYYLLSTKRQSFNFEPRATNSNGFLGVSASINYTNRNLFRGAEKLTATISGGFESQPPVFDENVNGEKIKTANRSFNTFEIGPSVKLELPGLFPIRFSDISNQLRPNTVISTAYNYQHRLDFKRSTFQMNYAWSLFISKTQVLQMGFPGLSGLKVIRIDKSAEFETKLLQLNDLFLLDAYRNQFIWQDWRFFYEYNIKNKADRKGNMGLYFSTSFDPAGNILSFFNSQLDTIGNGSYSIFGLQYSQFIRFDNQLIVSKPFTKERSVHGKLLVGGGIPYGNTTNTLPYDYSFFGGGANDNRGWRARALGPGAYKYYLDTNRTATQLGDLRLAASFEVRFPITSMIKGAYFIDAGNIWSLFDDPNRPGGQISADWYKEISLASGFGIRLDFKYFIIRTDIGFPVRNPALPKSSRWIWQSKTAYYEEAEAFFGENYKSMIPLPFIPQLHFGIGYPF